MKPGSQANLRLPSEILSLKKQTKGWDYSSVINVGCLLSIPSDTKMSKPQGSSSWKPLLATDEWSEERWSQYIVSNLLWQSLLSIKWPKNSNPAKALRKPFIYQSAWTSLPINTSSYISICFIQTLQYRARLEYNKTRFRIAKPIIFSAPTVLGMWLGRGGWLSTIF